MSTKIIALIKLEEIISLLYHLILNLIKINSVLNTVLPRFSEPPYSESPL